MKKNEKFKRLSFSLEGMQVKEIYVLEGENWIGTIVVIDLSVK